jgi:hypothetical protein
MTTFAGTLGDLRVSDVFQFLESAARTGTLVIERGGGLRSSRGEPVVGVPAERAQFAFESGRLVAARSPNLQPLGDFLLGRQVVDRSQIDEAVAAKARASDESDREIPLGEVLVRAGVLSRQLLHDCLADQIRSAVAEVLEWRRGDFEFSEEPVRSYGGFSVGGGEDLPPSGLPAVTLLAEATRIFAERSVRDTNPVGHPVLRSLIEPESSNGDSAAAAPAPELPPSRTAELFAQVRADPSSDMATLHLLRVVAELFDRGLLLRPGGGGFAVLGAFGSGREEILSAHALRALRVDFENPQSLEQESATLRGAEAREVLPQALIDLLPEEEPDEALLLPLASPHGLVAVVYAESDFGLPARDLEALRAMSRELAAQLGVGGGGSGQG